MSNEWEPANVYEVLADDRARQVLAATDDAKQSAHDIVNVCDGSLSSIYRRLDVLDEYGLIESEISIDEGGHHRRVYKPDFEAIHVRLHDAEIEVTIDHGEDTERYREQWSSIFS